VLLRSETSHENRKANEKEADAGVDDKIVHVQLHQVSITAYTSETFQSRLKVRRFWTTTNIFSPIGPLFFDTEGDASASREPRQ